MTKRNAQDTALEADIPVVARLQSENRAGERRLPASALPDNSQCLSSDEVKIDSIHSADHFPRTAMDAITEASGSDESAGEVSNLENGWGHVAR